MKRIVMDIDDTLTVAGVSDYSDAPARTDVIAQLAQYREMGFRITLFTARNMRTYDGDLDKIRANTLPVILQWLDVNDVPYDEVLIGKPWCGTEGFYVDDKAIRPDEFARMSYDEICALLNIDRTTDRSGRGD